MFRRQRPLQFSHFWTAVRQTWGARRSLLLLLAWATVSCFPGQIAAQDTDSARLESYLESLQLNRLLIEHLEREVGRETDFDQRIQTAGRLARLYTSELFKTQVDSGTARNWIRKSNELLAIYPSLRDSRLTLAILQARYLAEENVFHQWWISPTRSPRESLLANWDQLLQELSRFNKKMEDRYQELVAAEQASSGDVAVAKTLSQTETLLLHSSFLLGWSSYFRGVLEPKQRTDWLSQADQHFRDYLQIEPRKSLTDFSENWFDFDSTWNVRALVGLAMCHRGLDHPQQSEHCFELLRRNGNEETQEFLSVWQLNSRLYMEQFVAAKEFTEDFKNQTEISLDAQVAFWMNALQSSAAINLNSPEISGMLRVESLAGLVRTMQAPRIEGFIEKHPFDFKDDFIGNWAQGYLVLHRAKTAAPQQSEFDDAKHHLQRALRQVDARSQRI